MPLELAGLLQPPEVDAPPPFRVLDDHGTPPAGYTALLNDDAVRDALRLMMLARRVDERAFSLQRQGRFGTFSPTTGQEAAIVGSALATDPARDWLVPQYRELPALLRHGLPLEQFFLYFSGHPEAWVPEGVRILPIQIALGAQLPHAVGLAWGRRMLGTDEVVLVYFGDGASSQGDFHEACNLAQLQRAPVVFFLQDNGWAISTPRSAQTSADRFASRAAGYGMHSAVVDGNDLLAVHAVTSAAVHHARAGNGPTLIEAITYRVGPHNTADDPSRYVDEAVAEQWASRDPINRMKRYLRARDAWSAEDDAQAAADAEATVDAGLRAMEATAPAAECSLFEHVTERPSWRQEQQRQARLGQGS